MDSICGEINPSISLLLVIIDVFHSAIILYHHQMPHRVLLSETKKTFTLAIVFFTRLEAQPGLMPVLFSDLTFCL